MESPEKPKLQKSWPQECGPTFVVQFRVLTILGPAGGPDLPIKGTGSDQEETVSADCKCPKTNSLDLENCCPLLLASSLNYGNH